jgi:hypothetical protein
MGGDHRKIEVAFRSPFGVDAGTELKHFPLENEYHGSGMVAITHGVRIGGIIR